MKIIDKINEAKRRNQPVYSFEFFPPKTEAGVTNFYNRLDRMVGLGPSFIDITWGAGGSSESISLDIAENVQRFFGIDVMLHLTCTNMPKARLTEVLDKAKAAGVTNIMALRGDPPRGAKRWKACEDGLKYAKELVEFIKEKYGDHFGIGVGGYPEGHLEAKSKMECAKHLKEKVDAGADFIVTQLFYDLDEFFEFEKRCRDIGISCPILPGMLPIQNYSSFKRFTDFCKTKIPTDVAAQLEPIKNDDAAVQQYGVKLATSMIEKLIAKGAPGIHFYTLNLESSCVSILSNLGLADGSVSKRDLPWRPSALANRRSEDVRPIFWSNRPRSYLSRTQNWDEFPNGRWGNSASPAFGDLTEYYLLRRGIGLEGEKDSLAKMWGNPTSLDDVAKVFTGFCEGKINRLPWCETAVQLETSRITPSLVNLNRNGFFTINSQPQVNGTPSADPEVGWGGTGGFVYQKAYVEFFTSEEKLEKLISASKNFGSLTYHAINAAGQSLSNLDLSSRSVNAVTWGVFPGKEIVQPTVVDSESFAIWKDEAFALWLNEWAALYSEDSPSYKLLKGIHDRFYLVNIVENDYVNGDIFKVFGL